MSPARDLAACALWGALVGGVVGALWPRPNACVCADTDGAVALSAPPDCSAWECAGACVVGHAIILMRDADGGVFAVRYQPAADGGAFGEAQHAARVDQVDVSPLWGAP